MPVLVTDELNSPEYKPRSIDYKKYFGEMGLTKEQTKNRIDMANDIEDLMLFIFALIGVYSQYGMPDYTRIQNELQGRFETIISNYGTMDDYLQMFAQDFASDFIEVTELKVDKPWYTSEDRARFIAENEANAVHNYLDFEKAIKEGYTKKQWITLMDGKERPTHAKINKKIIPIGDLFAVGDALMRFPMDTEYASDFPREIIRCRCRLKYLDRDPELAKQFSEESNALREESLRNRQESPYNVDWHVVRSKEYTERFKAITDNEKASSLIAKRSRQALSNRDGKNTEELYAIDLVSGKDVASITDQHFAFRVARTEKFMQNVNRAELLGGKVLTIHNHPNGTPPSYADLSELVDHKDAVGITVGHNGSIYYYTKPNRVVTKMDFSIAEMHFKEYSDSTVRHEKTLEYLAESFGFVFRKL